MKNLEKLRKKKKMSREELAFKAQTTHASIYAYEKGTREAGVGVARRIAAALDVSMEQLMG